MTPSFVVTMSNIDGVSELFHEDNQKYSFNKVVIKGPPTPQMFHFVKYYSEADINSSMHFRCGDV